jgi:hypothetical protein
MNPRILRSLLGELRAAIKRVANSAKAIENELTRWPRMSDTRPTRNDHGSARRRLLRMARRTRKEAAVLFCSQRRQTANACGCQRFNFGLRSHWRIPYVDDENRGVPPPCRGQTYVAGWHRVEFARHKPERSVPGSGCIRHRKFLGEATRIEPSWIGIDVPPAIMRIIGRLTFSR